MATSAIIREISDSNLETERNSLKSGVSRIVQELELTALLSILCLTIFPQVCIGYNIVDS